MTCKRQFLRIGSLIGFLLVTGCGLFNPNPVPDAAHLQALIWNSSAGQLLWINAGKPGTQQIAIAHTGQHVGLCAESPDSHTLIVAYGDARQHLSLLTNVTTAAPIDLGETDTLTCHPGHTVFSPDGSALAYLNYSADQVPPPSASNISSLAVGTLHLVTGQTVQPIGTIDQIAAFDLQPSDLFAVSGSAAGLIARRSTWAQNKLSPPAPIGSPFLPDSGCLWVNSQIRAISGTSAGSFDRLLIALGEQCGTTVNQTVRLFSVPLSGGSAAEIYHQTITGTYSSAHVLSTLVTTPDHKIAYLAVPNGRTPDLADIVKIDLTQPSKPASTILADVELARSALNPAQTQWGLIALNAGGGETVSLIDLTHADQDIIPMTDNNRSSTVGGLTWNQTGNRLIYTHSGNDSALAYLDLSGALASVIIDKFQAVVTDPAGKVALTVRASSKDLIVAAIPVGSTQTLIAGQPNVTLIPLALIPGS